MGKQYQEFISEQVAQGPFCIGQRGIRAGLRLLEEREANVSLLRRARVEGEENLLYELDREA